MSKYNAKKVEYESIKFDSKRECVRYVELKMLEEAGLIKNLRLQVPFTLIPSQKIDGKVVERACTYKADFVYEEQTENGWEEVVEDVKSKATQKDKVYRLKKKLMLERYGVQIRETL